MGVEPAGRGYRVPASRLWRRQVPAAGRSHGGAGLALLGLWERGVLAVAARVRHRSTQRRALRRGGGAARGYWLCGTSTSTVWTATAPPLSLQVMAME